MLGIHRENQDGGVSIWAVDEVTNPSGPFKTPNLHILFTISCYTGQLGVMVGRSAPSTLGGAGPAINSRGTRRCRRGNVQQLAMSEPDNVFKRYPSSVRPHRRWLQMSTRMISMSQRKGRQMSTRSRLSPVAEVVRSNDSTNPPPFAIVTNPAGQHTHPDAHTWPYLNLLCIHPPSPLFSLFSNFSSFPAPCT